MNALQEKREVEVMINAAPTSPVHEVRSVNAELDRRMPRFQGARSRSGNPNRIVTEVSAEVQAQMPANATTFANCSLLQAIRSAWRNRRSL